MNPFSVSPNCEALVDRYPASEILRETLTLAPEWEREAVVRLWLLEGIPFAFRERPFFYESMRVFLGKRLGIAPHTITIIGSGRIGYSLAPKKFGRPFSADSDFDVLTVSQPLYDRLSADLHCWVEDYKARRVLPRNPTEAKYWDDHVTLGPINASRGFVDQWKIPNLANYPVARDTSQAMFAVRERLAHASAALAVRKVSLRVYRDWNSLAKQSLLNLSLLVGRKVGVDKS